MQRSSDQLFSGAGLSINEHSGIGGRHNLDFLQDSAKRFAISDNFFEVKFAADLGFKIDIFLRKLILECGNLPIREGIFNGESDLIGDLTEEGKIILGEVILARTAKAEYAEHAFPDD